MIVLTDVHTWIGGHGRQEPYVNVDYCDVLSFYEHVKEYCNQNQIDLWFVSNGDFVHGTGLSRWGDVSSLVPLIEKMPWDALTSGNHELYKDPIVDYMLRPGGWAEWWGSRYLTARTYE